MSAPEEESSADTALRNAFLASDLFETYLVDLLMDIETMDSLAKQNGGRLNRAAPRFLQQRVKGMAMTLGILRSALTDLRVHIPESKK